jgi:hypothetical protein
VVKHLHSNGETLISNPTEEERRRKKRKRGRRGEG